MACRNITKGRIESCKDQVGGLKAIYFINHTQTDFDASDLNATTHTFEGFANGPITLFKYELKSFNSSFEQSNEVSRENGTSFFTQTATVVLKSQDESTTTELLAMSKTNPAAIIQDQNDNYFLLGFRNGLDVSVATTSGTALGDLNGYSLSITGLEPELAPFVDAAIIGNTSDTTITDGV